MALPQVSLDDKYTLESGRVFLTGTQALVRLPMLQRQRDAAAGLDTAGFVSGYRGSPLGGLDQALWKAKPFLDRAHVRFQPGVNEDLAAASVWGTQQLNLFPGAKHDGVFAMWYGKGPGVDRCGDVFKHANAAGTSRHGGVLLVAGDDHAAKSSTLPHQSDHMFAAAAIPLLYPAGVQEYLDYGIHGWAMSRYSGCWVAFKALADTVESSASVSIDPHRVRIALPEDFAMPPGGLNIRWPDPPLAQEQRLLHHKAYAALAYCRANALNRVAIDSPRARLGIIASGKSYLDVRQALDDLGIDEAHAAEIGLRLFKVGMVWPLESEGVRRFAEGLEEILVVEEKRQVVEYQLKEHLYNWREDVRPRVIGKFDEKGEWALPHGDWLLPAAGELTPAMIARVIAARIARYFTSERIQKRLAFLDAKERALEKPAASIARIPWFCPGCPHNTSTRVPEGSRALAGIGCHYMVLWMDRSTATFSHMGGEGAAWIGQAPFTDERHVFANLGDGTYFHSGLLAIRATVAAGVNLTYKILYNDAVAMTGGQPVDGQLTVPQITRQIAAEGVRRTVIVSDEPEKYASAGDLAEGVTVRRRDELDDVQRDLREESGVTALIYDQTCAAEKRRRRKRGRFPDPARRVVINEAVCEGCGDCGAKSNCVAIDPVETEFGRKRAIDQSACNKDYSCLMGFCPSFVTVEGGRLRKGAGRASLPARVARASVPAAVGRASVPAGNETESAAFGETGRDARPTEPAGTEARPAVPEPTRPDTRDPWGILVTGIGGTGVVTIGALLGMAAHLEGKGVTVLDMTGLAQKGGAVLSHIRIADNPEAIHAVRIAAGEANAVIACDILVAAGAEALAKMQAGITRAVVNRNVQPTGEFVRKPDLAFDTAAQEREIAEATGEGGAEFVEASRIATALMGDSIATNVFMLGYAYQKGLVPVSSEAILKAIELNDAAVEMNAASFHWGRSVAHDPASVAELAKPEGEAGARRLSATLDEAIERRVEYLTAYQDAAYAQRYRRLVDRVRSAEAVLGGGDRLAGAVARGYFKLLAYKDEYEVARLHSAPEFLKRIEDTFEGDYRLVFHLAPPLLSKPDPVTGESPKRPFGRWMLDVFRGLAKLKHLRGTWLDPFGYMAERRLERQLIAGYERVLEELLDGLDAGDLGIAAEIAALPEQVRGFGPVKARNLEAARRREAELLERFRNPGAPLREAA